MRLHDHLLGESRVHQVAASILCPLAVLVVLFGTMNPTEPFSAMFGTQTSTAQVDAFTGCESWAGPRTCGSIMASRAKRNEVPTHPVSVRVKDPDFDTVWGNSGGGEFFVARRDAVAGESDEDRAEIEANFETRFAALEQK